MQNTVVAGALASVLSTMVLAVAGRRQTGSAYAPTNAVSHWLWGRPALAKNAPSWRHTAVGYLIHHGSAMLWSWLYASWQRQRQDTAALPLLGTAAAVTALASAVDFKVAPERLHPGFEHRLSTPALVAVYAAFGLGLALPYLLRGRGPRAKQWLPVPIAYTEIR
ncbi:MAG: hypothetical protein ACJ8HI_23175 [Massilia sp.]